MKTKAIKIDMSLTRLQSILGISQGNGYKTKPIKISSKELKSSERNSTKCKSKMMMKT
jgi:hypothetical protein